MLDDDELQRIYQWVDEIPLSRTKRNIARDFADGVLTAEIVAHYFPRLVEMHNYPAANSFATKMYNWNTLNGKVFKKMGFQLREEELTALCNCQPQAVEQALKQLQQRMARYGARKEQHEKSVAEMEGGACSPTGTAGYDDYAARPGSRGTAHPSGRASATSHRASCGSGVCSSGGSAAALESGLGQLGLEESAVHELLAEKDHNLRELRETVEILEIKIQKLEQLVRLKDSKIQTLQARLSQS